MGLWSMDTDMTQDMKILEKLGHNTVEIQQLINYYILGIFIYL